MSLPEYESSGVGYESQRWTGGGVSGMNSGMNLGGGVEGGARRTQPIVSGLSSVVVWAVMSSSFKSGMK